MKKTKLFLFALMAFFVVGFAVNVKAEDISTLNDLRACLHEDESNCVLTEDIEVTDDSLETFGNVVLDLNGHTIAPSSDLSLPSQGLLFVHYGAKLTINDSKGTGLITSGEKVMLALQLTKKDVGDNTKAAELIVNGGTFKGYNYVISGNGNRHNTKTTINGGTFECLIEDDCTAIYHPQNGEITINDGNIMGPTGIEIRSGQLTINGGNISGDITHNGVNPNGDGTTTYGVAVAVAQHNTKLPIDVTVNGGTFTGFVALKQSNPQQNPYEDISKVSMNITGGTFNGTSDQSVYSEDLTGFISGGTYNVSPDTKYVAEGFHIFNLADKYMVADGDLKDAVLTGIKTKTYNNGYAQRQNDLVVTLYDKALVKDVDYRVTYKNYVNAGTATMTITGIGNYTGEITKEYKIKKAKNPLAIKAYNKTVSYSKVKKSAQVVKPIYVSKKVGTLTYTKMSGSSTKLLLNKTTGKVTVKKGTKKGKYKIKIKVFASGSSNYFSNYGIKTIYVTVK